MATRETDSVAKTNTYFHAMNVGVHDKTALARVDLERMRLAAEEQTNLLCKATGPGFMRPGQEYLSTTAGNAEARLKEFVFGVSDAALFEFTNQALRVFVNDQVITRQAVSCAVPNGDFGSATGWDLTGINSGTASISGGKLHLNATVVESTAVCKQVVNTSSPNQEHALRILVERGPVNFRCGSASGQDDYIADTVLTNGEHSLAFTPTGSFWVQFSSTLNMEKIVDSIQIEAAGVMVLPTPWLLADLPNLRIAQSADVCFAACDGHQQRRIERRGSRSWSVGIYQTDDGPFDAPTSQKLRLKPSGLFGNVTITSSAPYFTADMVGSLLRLDHSGQNLVQLLAADDTYTDPIRVTGLTTQQDDRDFVRTITGVWTGTLSLERSYTSAEAGFTRVEDYTGNSTASFGDSDDNSIYWYRIGFEPTRYGSGLVSVSIGYDGGGGYGICRIIGYTSPTLVSVEVLRPFKNSNWTKDWRACQWSTERGWPSAVVLSDGRLWWSGADRIWGSVSDAYASFDEETEGDSGPISRSIATGGVNNSQWLLSLQRLLVGTEGAIATVKSSSLDEPLTPTNFGIRDSSTTGAAPVDAIKVDTRGIFVERAGTALLELTFDGGAADYSATQISKLTTDIFESGVKAIAVQRRPDTRVWLVLNDGSAVCMLYEKDQEVLAFIPIATDGLYESVAVLPALEQDRVYVSVNRTINGSTVRYIEKMAMDSEVKPSTFCKVMDAFKSGTNSPASVTVPVGSHLIGESVVVWADGAPIETSYGVPATFTVDGSGNITLPSVVTNWVAGLPYRARYKSARLAYGAQGGTAMLQKKTVDALGLIMTDFVRSGLKYGHSFDDPYRGLFPLPQMADCKTQPNVVLSDIRDEESFSFPGEWSTDSRVCLEISSPYTATLPGLVISVTTNER